MAEPSRPPVTPLGQALGRIPSGLYILTVRNGGRATGMLASWVQQAGFDPPMLTVALGGQRYVAGWVAAAGRFTLNQLPVGSKHLIRHFGRGFPPEAPAFEGLKLRPEGRSGPVLEGALAFLDAEVAGGLDSGDHRIILGRIVDGAVFDAAAEPMVHVRNNGFHY
jgi:flavin reductase (DIM6/NTAB) family NADH-FMN oxidoreductase RutF